MSASFTDWVAAADAVRATTKKLVKMDVLATYLAGLGEGDLAVAARLFAGRPFARADERVLSLGWSALVEAVLDRARRSSDDLRASYQRHADLGDVAAELLAGTARDDEPLALKDIAAAFASIASAKGSAAKRSLLRQILGRTDAAEARYVVKLMTGEPRIGLREGLLEDAVARAFGAKREAVARAHMLSGDIGEVAQRARSGTLADAVLVPFTPVGMMLATPVLQLEEVAKRFSPPYVIEDKYDGVRAQVHKSGDRVELYSRTFDRVTDRFPELLEGLRSIPGAFILDAEVLSFANGRAIPFVRFQRRLGRKEVAAALRAELPATLVAFDILERDGRALLDAPLSERHDILRSLPLREPIVFARQRLVDHSGDALTAALDAEFTAARERGNEGLMVKDPRSPYRPGRRGMEWLKVKRALRTLDVVVTAVEWGHGKRHGVLSDYTFAVRDGDRLLEVGKAYSGLTDAEIAERTEHFLANTVTDHGRLRMVEPDTVIEVAFDSVQRSTRHPSGYALRFPRIVRLRHDKPVADIDTLRTVREIADSIV